MAERIDLRAYRESLASRLAAAQAGAGLPALLGFESGGRRWLVELAAAGEVLPLPAVTPVPLTQAWFAGLANVHGELQEVVDFAALCGAAPTPQSAAARLLRVGARHGSRVALLVERMHGLLRADSLQAAAAAPAAPWQDAAYTDTRGARWLRLDVERLLALPELADAALPAAGAPP
jgi:twitching motility protein PilI